MSYLCIFDGDFAYYNESDYFKEGKSYILEKKDLEYETNISFRPYSALQNMDMQISQGRITYLYQNLYYTEYLNELPTQFNNHSIFEETFPISMERNLPNVFSFMRKDPADPEKIFPVVFMFLSAHKNNWDFYFMQTETIRINGSGMGREIELDDVPYDFLTFSYNESKQAYQLDTSEDVRNIFFLINDDNVLISLENELLLENAKTYRFIYDDKYIFIVGGSFILYAKL